MSGEDRISISHAVLFNQFRIDCILSSFQKCIQPEEHFRQHVENGVRPDGREDLCALRPVSISAGTIGTADGSAVVKQGQTVGFSFTVQYFFLNKGLVLLNFALEDTSGLTADTVLTDLIRKIEAVGEHEAQERVRVEGVEFADGV